MPLGSRYSTYMGADCLHPHLTWFSHMFFNILLIAPMRTGRSPETLVGYQAAFQIRTKHEDSNPRRHRAGWNNSLTSLPQLRARSGRSQSHAEARSLARGALGCQDDRCVGLGD